MTQSIPQTLPEAAAEFGWVPPAPGYACIRETFSIKKEHRPAQGEKINLYTEEQLLAALAAQPLVGVIPEGMALVPIEPTPEMLAATDIEDTEYYFHSVEGAHGFLAGHYRAMLAAAPQPPAVQQDRGDAAAQGANDEWATYKERCQHGVRWENICAGCGRATQGVDHG